MAISFSLEGKRALVTGANTGIGQGIAIALGEAGAEVLCTSHQDSDETVKIIKDAGGKAVSEILDLSNPMNGKTFIEAYDKPIDILVNNAGLIRRDDAVDFSEKDWDDVMDMNVKAVFFTCQGFAKKVLERGGTGKIINIASMLSFQGGIRVPSYTASKSGVAGITKLMCNEWAAKGINVNAIAPGYIATNNTAALRADEKRSAEILGRIPADRWGDPADLGGTAVFLASPAADYINGAILNVDGGWLAR
ncbi:2-dehydro-3-deoxy-D-gluconate 5-dehydrogenase KduD [Martelella lutilitoris]|uniref:2-dehydro-3-deoxy-D-gluconate 5-dehydrogenase KduD n=1 Tax=Martelella lutilitoris TaxID=2583532 RepID=A0A5C4JU95_9HYPH|nr:2-dehydro-3-deoxy-D-gluconate 5-dehydrogenase KduD [Martelella lutilitoris]TNB48721.1 2-dehydro-3-deoxy-D-gluconate 5-dehydrogenase KduD [Martelella lutilitoris]